MVEPIDPALARKLDAFTVPGLPAGFSDAVLARARVSTIPDLPRQRRAASRRWWRTGASTLGALAAATISISAAASGYFGEPIRRAVETAPVIGPVVERVAPRLVTPPRPLVARAAAKPPAASVEAAAPVPPVPGIEPDRIDDIQRLMDERLADRPEARAWIERHPARAERIVRRAALASALRDARAARQQAFSARDTALAEARLARREALATGDAERRAALAEARRVMRESRGLGEAERTAAIAQARAVVREARAEAFAAGRLARARAGMVPGLYVSPLGDGDGPKLGGLPAETRRERLRAWRAERMRRQAERAQAQAQDPASEPSDPAD